MQERLTSQIATTIETRIAPLGVAVVVEATHLCMAMRGVEKQNSITTTSAMLGVFHDDARTRNEFLAAHQKRRADVASAAVVFSRRGLRDGLDPGDWVIGRLGYWRAFRPLT